jgi:hypothetical protein
MRFDEGGTFAAVAEACLTRVQSRCAERRAGGRCLLVVDAARETAAVSPSPARSPRADSGASHQAAVDNPRCCVPATRICLDVLGIGYETFPQDL